jgi:hypothetical protein
MQLDAQIKRRDAAMKNGTKTVSFSFLEYHFASLRCERRRGADESRPSRQVEWEKTLAKELRDVSGLRNSPPYFGCGDLSKSNNDISVIRLYERLGSF